MILLIILYPLASELCRCNYGLIEYSKNIDLSEESKRGMSVILQFVSTLLGSVCDIMNADIFITSEPITYIIGQLTVELHGHRRKQQTDREFGKIL